MINLLKNAILNLIRIIEKFEYRHTDLDQDDVTKKIMDSLDLSDVMIDADTGWERITHIHKTQPYNIIKIELENGMYLEGADLHIVFTKNYEEVFIKNLKIGDEIITRNGLSKVSSIINHETYVSMFDVTVQGKNHRYWSNDILSHNTICSSIYIVWYSLFNFDKNALILANVGKTTAEIIDKGKVIFEHLPFYLKPGVLKWDIFNTKFDNGCRIIGQTTTKKSAIGFTIHLLFMDEFAHINPSFIDSFYENVYPTISSSKVAKVIITSTPNGFNKFYDLYTEAVDGLNEYTPFRVDWWDVPGRDEAWMQREISNLGGEDAFNRQYGNLFVTGSSLLLPPSSILKLKENSTTFVHREIYELDDYGVDYSKLVWHPKYNIDTIKDDAFCVAIDIAEGGGGDYSVLNVFKIEAFSHKEINKIQNPTSIKDFFKLKQIALWRCNTTDIADFSKLIYYVTHMIMNIDNIKIILEWNTYGAEVLKNLEKFPEFDEESLIKFKHRIDAKFKSIGLKVTSGNKTLMCTSFKKHIAQNRIELLESKTVAETSSYGPKPNGTYGAQMGHDDTTATAIEAAEIFSTQEFEDLCEIAMDWLMENDAATYDLIDIKLENTNQDEEFSEAELL